MIRMTGSEEVLKKRFTRMKETIPVSSATHLPRGLHHSLLVSLLLNHSNSVKLRPNKKILDSRVNPGKEKTDGGSGLIREDGRLETRAEAASVRGNTNPHIRLVYFCLGVQPLEH